MNLIDVTRELGTEDDCLGFLEGQRWPDGVVRCTVCGCDRVSRITRKTASKNKRTRVYQCLEPTCKQQFSATSGTIFNDTHLPLTKWFMAIAIIVDAKKGVSAKQLQQHLGIGSYKTAWYLGHRIRKAMEVKSLIKMDGIVEIDETYIGGKVRTRNGSGRAIKTRDKQVVVGIKQRGGRIRLQHVPDSTSETLAGVIQSNVSSNVDAVFTDEYSAYPKALLHAGINEMFHYTVNHSKYEYVRDGFVTTNGIESHFGLLKRGIVGSFHRLSIKHLHRYLSEFEYRFNARKDADRFGNTVREMTQTRPMEFKQLTAGV